MQGKIGLEEHFAIPDTLLGLARVSWRDAVWPELEKRLLDIQDYRLRQMDENGMELMLLSLNAPAVQAIPDAARADRDRAARQRLSRRGGAQAPASASRASPPSRCRIRTAPRASSSAA